MGIINDFKDEKLVIMYEGEEHLVEELRLALEPLRPTSHFTLTEHRGIELLDLGTGQYSGVRVVPDNVEVVSASEFLEILAGEEQAGQPCWTRRANEPVERKADYQAVLDVLGLKIGDEIELQGFTGRFTVKEHGLWKEGWKNQHYVNLITGRLRYKIIDVTAEKIAQTRKDLTQLKLENLTLREKIKETQAILDELEK